MDKRKNKNFATEQQNELKRILTYARDGGIDRLFSLIRFGESPISNIRFVRRI